MKLPILFILFLSILEVSCNKSTNKIEIGISDFLHYKTPFRNKHCNSDYYYNIIIRNDSLIVNGRLKNKSGNYIGLLNQYESENLSTLVEKMNPKNRIEKEYNPTTGMTALITKKNGVTLDSIVNFKIEWSADDLKMFDYIGELICNKEMIETKNDIYYPTYEMVRPSK